MPPETMSAEIKLTTREIAQVAGGTLLSLVTQQHGATSPGRGPTDGVGLHNSGKDTFYGGPNTVVAIHRFMTGEELIR